MLPRILRRRPPAESRDSITPYAVPPHAWQAAAVYVLSADDAADYATGDEATRWRILGDMPASRATGPVCQLCGEDWHPAIALMPCRR